MQQTTATYRARRIEVPYPSTAVLQSTSLFLPTCLFRGTRTFARKTYVTTITNNEGSAPELSERLRHVSTIAVISIIAICLALGAALTIPALKLTSYMGLAGASITLIGASIGLASGTQQAVLAGGVLALISGLLGIGIGFLVGMYRRKYRRTH